MEIQTENNISSETESETKSEPDLSVYYKKIDKIPVSVYDTRDVIKMRSTSLNDYMFPYSTVCVFNGYGYASVNFASNIFSRLFRDEFGNTQNKTYSAEKYKDDWTSIFKDIKSKYDDPIKITTDSSRQGSLKNGDKLSYTLEVSDEFLAELEAVMGIDFIYYEKGTVSLNLFADLTEYPVLNSVKYEFDSSGSIKRIYTVVDIPSSCTETAEKTKEIDLFFVYEDIGKPQVGSKINIYIPSSSMKLLHSFGIEPESEHKTIIMDVDPNIAFESEG